MISLESPVGKAIVAVREAIAEQLVAEHMHAVFPGEEWRTKLNKANKKVKRKRGYLADTVLETYCHIPSTVLKDLK